DTHTLSLKHIHTHTHTLSLTQIHTHTHTHTHAHTHTRTHTHTHKFTNTQFSVFQLLTHRGEGIRLAHYISLHLCALHDCRRKEFVGSSLLKRSCFTTAYKQTL